ncbi:MAG: hypothetical protein JF609_11815 [Verrucomicrobia bacterium]|nr:hypothetical protein [Verrucomicrobiota bacterium]
MKTTKYMANQWIAACTESSRLLNFLSEAARRAATGGFSWEFGFSASGHFRDDFTPVMAGNVLTRHEIFRGKVSRRNNQNQKTTSKKGRNRA